jgi:hypothetical protein
MAEVMMGDWSGKFSEIEMPCLVMLNWMLAWGVETRGWALDELWPQVMPASFRVDLKLGLLVWLGWDTDNTDIDLHVYEPDGTLISYGNKRSSTGGYLTKDFTQGYGPEVYWCAEPVEGSYRVLAKYYGSHQVSSSTGTTSCVLWRVTNLGIWDKEEIEFKTVRLAKGKEDLEVMNPVITERIWRGRHRWGREPVQDEELERWHGLLVDRKADIISQKKEVSCYVSEKKHNSIITELEHTTNKDFFNLAEFKDLLARTGI